MTRRMLLALLAWPIVPAAIAVLFLINSEAVPVACRLSDVGFRRPIYSTCLPTLLPDLTGPDPALVRVSWALVGAFIYLGLLGWSAFARRRASGGSATPGLRRWILLTVPVVPAVAVVAYLMGGDGIPHFCPSHAYPILGYACLPALFHGLTGSDPIVISVSWLAVAALAYVGLLGWGLALGARTVR